MSTFHPEYLVDDQNRRKAVVLPIAEWRQLLEQLDELEEIRAYDKAKSQPSDPIEFEEGLRRIRSGEEG